jgi:hypothetical protein
MKIRACLVPNPDHETRKTRTRIWHMWTRIQQDFITKKKQNKAMTRNIPKIGVE